MERAKRTNERQDEHKSCSQSYAPKLLILTYTCPLKWDEFTGTHAIRHCDQCSLSVHNISHTSESEVETLFDRANRGERVCMRSEGLGPLKSENSLPALLSWKFRLAAASSIAVAWAAAMLRSPVCAEETKSGTNRAPVAGAVSQNTFHLDGNPVVPPPPVTNASPLASVERYGFMYAPPPTDSESTWKYIHALKTFDGFPKQASELAEKVRTSIINRAENDKIVSTDEIIELSNLYRREGFESGADSCLEIANTLLEYGQTTPAHGPRRLTNARIGGGLFTPYDHEAKNELADWEKRYAVLKKPEDVADAFCSMQTIVHKILGNPIMLIKLSAADMNQLHSNIELLKKHCGDTYTLSQVELHESRIKQRRRDFANVLLSPDDQKPETSPPSKP